jgi:CheY-like chemotaxis protein
MKPHLDLLLVDDDAVDVLLFSRAAKESGLGLRLRALKSGQQAIDYLQAKGEYADRSLHPMPDLIVLDLNMPGVTGFEFLAWRKPSVIFSSIPVIVLSGFKNDGAGTAAELGADKYIAKSNDPMGWKRIVQEVWDFGIQGAAFLQRNNLAAE